MFYISFLTTPSTLDLLLIATVFMQLKLYTLNMKGSFVCYL